MAAPENTRKKWITKAKSVIKGVFALGVVLTMIWVGLYYALQAFDTYLRLFPEEIPGMQATNLLNAIIQTDGILIGFFAFVFAASLSGLVSQAGAIMGEIARRFHMAGLIGVDSIRKAMKTKGTAEYEYHRLLAELEKEWRME